MSRYRNIHCLAWNDKKFLSLSDDARSVWFHIFTNPLSNALGLFKASILGLADEINWDADRYYTGLNECIEKGLLQYDTKSKVVFFPNFLKWNRPENPSVLSSWLKCWDEIPESHLKIYFVKVLIEKAKLWGEGYLSIAKNLDKDLVDTSFSYEETRVRTGVPTRVGTPVPHREQEQDQEQEQDKEIYVEQAEEVIHSPVDNSDIVEQARHSSDENKILKIFEHWQTEMKHPNAILDDKRKRVIRKALKIKHKDRQYSVDDLFKAISGCAKSAWHMGGNDRKQRFDDIGLILRDAEHIEKFMWYFHNPPNEFQKVEKPIDDKKTQASRAWGKVKRAVRETQFANSVIFDDKIIHAVVNEIAGNWRNLGKENIDFLEHKFVKSYLHYTDNPPESTPEILSGRYELEAKNPYNHILPEQLKPRYFGELH